VYRAPYRGSGSIELNELEGFALVTETRVVHLPAGESRVRFEGVADGIEPASAIVTGLPSGVLEKNRDARLLSPGALVAASVGKAVVLVRTNSKTGVTQRMAGMVLADAEGVVFKTEAGIEALRCSGLSETFGFTGATEPSATPTLSILVRTSQPVTRRLTLSYLARGFDWAANYTATLSTDGKTMDLGAWVTLANGNGVGFPSAHTQVVAGRLNRESDEVEPIDPGRQILAECWPRGSTSDSPQPMHIELASALGAERSRFARYAPAMPVAAMAMSEIAVSARKVEQEQLGDLKLYRVPERTTVASRQSKQVRLLDRLAVPVHRVYGADLAADETTGWLPASEFLRTTNDVANHLGLPLPSGRIDVLAARGNETLLLHESGIRDLATDEEVEIDMGVSPDVQVSLVKEITSIDARHAHVLPLVPGVLDVRTAQVDDIARVEVSNARASEIHFELRLVLHEGARVIRANRPLGTKNGRPIFRFTVPANETVTVRYQTSS
jgi:hypothetical protein